jgi:predicted transposase YbfD/YdcC
MRTHSNPKAQNKTTLAKTSLVAHLSQAPDPRINQTKKDHELVDVLVIAVCALLCAGDTFNDMEDCGNAKLDFFETILNLENGVPSHDTFNRVFAALNPKQFPDCFLRWTQSMRAAVSQKIVALDGKALRRAMDKDQNVQYVVSAWAESNGLVLGQLKVNDKNNEITAVPELLRVLELGGCIVTTDAISCQTKIAKEIIEADADYVHATPLGAQSAQAGENKETRPSRQATQRKLEPRLFAPLTRNLDASALQKFGARRRGFIPLSSNHVETQRRRDN